MSAVSPRSIGMRRRHVLGASVLLIGLLTLGGWYTSFGPGKARRVAREAVLKGQDYLKQGRPALAMRAVAGLPESGPSAAGVLAIRGMALALLDRPDDARRPLEQSLALDPGQPMVAKVLAAICFSHSEYDRGLELLERAARLDPEDFRPWYGAGDMYRRLNRPEDAARAFEQALSRRPDHHPSRVGMIWARMKYRPPQEITTLLNQALAEQPDDPELLTLAAEHAEALGHSDEALRLVERSLAIEPNRAEALLIRGRSHLGAGRLQQALEDAQSAVTLAPQDPAALYLLARVEAGLGLEEQAAATNARRQLLTERLERMRSLEQEIERHPDDPTPRWQLGQVAAESGMTDFAARHFRAALALDPGCQPALRGLADLGIPAPRPSLGGLD